MSILDEITLESEPRAKEFIPSEFQSAIFDQMPTPEPLLVQAVAGSGKTTTLIEATKRTSGSNLFMAFNKAIAQDILAKGASGTVKTLNAMGHSVVMANRGGELNARKVPNIIKSIMGDTTAQREYAYAISRLVGLAKNLALGIEHHCTTAEFVHMVEASDIPADFAESAVAIAFEAFEQSRLDTKTFDFDDQLWMPLYERWEFPQFDNVFVDEAQDLSPIQHAMLAEFKGSKLVAVGDRHQAIYGFRGALHDSMDSLKNSFGMSELPLSVCYRCSSEVISYAKMFCEQIRAREGAPDGSVMEAREDPSLFTSENMIVCRNNGPLFAAILRKVRAKEPCQVLSSFLESFQNFIRGFKTKFTSDLMAKLDRWREKEIEAAKTRSKQILIQDKYDTLKLLAAEYKQTEDIIWLLKKLADSRSGPIFSTIHKAKGLEHESVYILRPDLLGGFGDLSPEQQQQEDNLHYVAITRAKLNLTYGVSKK